MKIQKDLVTPHLQGHNMENLLTLHHLAVDPLRVLTGEGHDFLRIVEVLLWYSVPNSAEEFSGIKITLLYPFLASDHSKTLNL